MEAHSAGFRRGMRRCRLFDHRYLMRYTPFSVCECWQGRGREMALPPTYCFSGAGPDARFPRQNVDMRISPGPLAALASKEVRHPDRDRTLSFEPLLLTVSGRSAAWLARVLWEHEVPGSNPGAPTISQNPRRTHPVTIRTHPAIIRTLTPIPRKAPLPARTEKTTSRTAPAAFRNTI